MKSASVIACLAMLGLVAACGGSDDDPVVEAQPSTQAVPVSATASAQAFSNYAKSLAADDRAEPLDVAQVVPPTSETEEPIALN